MGDLIIPCFTFFFFFSLLNSSSSASDFSSAKLANDWSRTGEWIERVVWRYKDDAIRLIDDASASKELSHDCSSALRTWSAGLSARRLWAFQMLDSTSLGDSGFINRFVEFGDYDLCLSVSAPDQQFHGRHCLARLEFALPPTHLKDWIPRIDISNTSMQDSWLEKCAATYKYLYFEKLTTGICFPSSCSPMEIELLLNSGQFLGLHVRCLKDGEIFHRTERPGAGHILAP